MKDWGNALKRLFEYYPAARSTVNRISIAPGAVPPDTDYSKLA